MPLDNVNNNEGSGETESHTYYTHLEERAAETEHDLINTFINHEKCLNVQGFGVERTKGIVYVLVYKSPSGN